MLFLFVHYLVDVFFVNLLRQSEYLGTCMACSITLATSKHVDFLSRCHANLPHGWVWVNTYSLYKPQGAEQRETPEMFSYPQCPVYH